MSDSAGRLAVLAAGLFVLAAGAGGVAALGDGTAQLGVDADSVTLQADVAADGDADWSVVYRIRLDDENATAAFEELQADIASDPQTYVDPFGQRMERTAAGAENATGREMTIRNVTVETSRESQPQVTYGVVTYRLEWTNFAAVDGEAVRAGDAVDRLFLDPETSLRLTAPEGYAVESSTPTPDRTDSGEVVWEGQRDFDAGEPRVTFVPAEAATDTPASGSDGGDGSGDGSGGGLPVVALVAVAVMVLLGGVWVVTRGGTGLPGGDGDRSGTEAASPEGGPPPELLSNEERVLGLLEENGGRMKQKEVAERLDWTAAKTSQVVGDLREADELDSFRLGRENVLTLPGVDIDAGDDDGE